MALSGFTSFAALFLRHTFYYPSTQVYVWRAFEISCYMLGHFPALLTGNDVPKSRCPNLCRPCDSFPRLDHCRHRPSVLVPHRVHEGEVWVRKRTSPTGWNCARLSILTTIRSRPDDWTALASYVCAVTFTTSRLTHQLTDLGAILYCNLYSEHCGASLWPRQAFFGNITRRSGDDSQNLLDIKFLVWHQHLLG